MKAKIFGILILTCLTAILGCQPSSNPFAAPALLSNNPGGNSSCPFLGAQGSATGNGTVVSGASGSTAQNSYYAEGFTLSAGFTAQSLQALLANSGSGAETFYAALYNSSNALVAGSAVTFVVQGSPGLYFAWQTFDYASGITLVPGTYTLFGYITNGTNVALGGSSYSGGCLLGKGSTSNLSGFPSSINGNNPTFSSSSLGMLVSSCP